MATKNKMMDFLHEAAERIIIMNTVYKKVRGRQSNIQSTECPGEYVRIVIHMHICCKFPEK